MEGLAWQQNCTNKLIQQTTVSSPYLYGDDDKLGQRAKLPKGGSIETWKLLAEPARENREQVESIFVGVVESRALNRNYGNEEEA